MEVSAAWSCHSRYDIPMAFDDYRHGLRHDGSVLSIESAQEAVLLTLPLDFHLVKGA